MKNVNSFPMNNFSEITTVSMIISQACQIQGRAWLAKNLLNAWMDAVLKNKDFIHALRGFDEYLRMNGGSYSLTDFIRGALQLRFPTC